MHFRSATPTDAPSIATLLNHAFAEDPLFCWLWPRHASYPHLGRDSWLRSIRSQLYLSRGSFVLVAVADASDEPRSDKRGTTSNNNDNDMTPNTRPEDPSDGHIVGVAIWRRSGTSAAARSWQSVNHHSSSLVSVLPPLRILESFLHNLQERYIYLLNLEAPAGDPFRMRAWDDETARGLDDIMKAREHWHMGMLGVDEKYRGRGIARKLVEFGLQNAEREGVPCMLVSAPGAKELYRKLGFRIVGWAPFDAEVVEVQEMQEARRKRGSWGWMPWARETRESGADEVENVISVRDTQAYALNTQGGGAVMVWDPEERFVESITRSVMRDGECAMEDGSVGVRRGERVSPLDVRWKEGI
ncbi:MAG: hypothetical protein M1831_003335 [Alyxoria varia]|nr:MAG: hypothetical protein M1831_003335 [Alyxoria varia]